MDASYFIDGDILLFQKDIEQGELFVCSPELEKNLKLYGRMVNKKAKFRLAFFIIYLTFY